VGNKRGLREWEGVVLEYGFIKGWSCMGQSIITDISGQLIGPLNTGSIDCSEMSVTNC
jgi:hypothetical protein